RLGLHEGFRPGSALRRPVAFRSPAVFRRRRGSDAPPAPRAAAARWGAPGGGGSGRAARPGHGRGPAPGSGNDMRILWVKVGGLWPPDSGGRLRSFHLISELSRRHSVILATTQVPGDDAGALSARLPAF